MSDRNSSVTYYRLADFLFKASLFALFGIIFLKALLNSFTHDEAYTYLRYVTGSTWDIISFNNATANNHLLNSLLSKFSGGLFGDSEISLRLPNVLAFLVFILSGYRWVSKNTPLLSIRFFSFALLFLNPFLFEFFSMSRGYGLSALFVFLAIVELLNINRLHYNKYPIKLFLWLSLSVLSNFSTLVVFIAVSATYVIVAAQKDFRNWRHYLKIPFITSLGLGLLLYEPIRKLYASNQFYYGGDTGFYEDTFLSSYYKYLQDANYYEFLPNLLISVFIFTAFVALFLWAFKQFNLSESPGITLLLVLFIAIGINIGLHYLLGSKYLISRTALFYYVLLAMFFIATVMELSSVIKFNLFLKSLLVAVSIAMVFHFVATFHFNYFSEWKYDASSKEVVLKLNEIGEKAQKKLAVGSTFLFEPSFNYYIETRDLEWIIPMNRDGLQPGYDYYYIHEWDLEDSLVSRLIPLDTFELSGTYLFKNAPNDR